VPLVKFFLITPTTLFRLQCAAPLYSNHQRKSVISFVIYNLNRNLRFGQFSIGLLLRSNPRVKRRYCTGRTRQWTRTHTHAHARAHSFAPVRALYTRHSSNAQQRSKTTTTQQQQQQQQHTFIRYAYVYMHTCTRFIELYCKEIIFQREKR